jgi:hypothetical protein
MAKVASNNIPVVVKMVLWTVTGYVADNNKVASTAMFFAAKSTELRVAGKSLNISPHGGKRRRKKAKSYPTGTRDAKTKRGKHIIHLDIADKVADAKPDSRR